jgi:hypothetical protein
MQWCCPDREADSLYEEEQRQAMYVTSLQSKRNAADPQATLARSLPEYPPARQDQGRSAKPQLPPQNYLVSHPLFPPSTQPAQTRNLTLRRFNEERKIELWQRTSTLVDRASSLREEFGGKNQELQELVTQIDQHFG